MSTFQPIIPSPYGTPLPPLRLYSVAYDLRRDGQDYPGLWRALEEMNALPIQRSVWWVPSSLSVEQLRAVLRVHMDNNDSLTISEMSGAVAGYEAQPEKRDLIERYLSAFWPRG